MAKIENYDAVRNEYAKAWGEDTHMTDFCANEVAKAFYLSDGKLVIIDKQKIETSFCFGYNTDYSGHEQSDAERRRSAFLASAQAFKDANTKGLRDAIARMDKALGVEFSDTRLMPMVIRASYSGESAPLNIHEVRIMDWYAWDRVWESDKQYYSALSMDDLRTIREAYREVLEKFEKRLDTYLKRYGTSKLNTWTYWRDA